MARTNWVGLALLIGAGILTARRPEMVKARLNDALEFAEDLYETGSEQLEREVLPKARKVLKETGRTAAPLLATAGEVASDWLERGADVAQTAAQWGGETAGDLLEQGSKAAKKTKNWLGKEVNTRGLAQKAGALMDARLMKEMAMRLERQEKALNHLGRSVELAGRPRRGGLPLGWMALIGGAYYLYRNPQVLHQALDAIKGYIPANASQHLENAADAVKDGVERVSRGASPVDAAKSAAAEAGSEIGKAAKDAKQQAGDAVRDVAKDAENTAKGVSREAQKASA
jgi:hypothetical protein